MSESVSKPRLVTDNATLQELCKAWSEQSVLALDSEFIRVDTFYPQLGLLQVCDGEGSYLLDPLTLTDWAAFRSVLMDRGITKVLHSCSEDLLVFKEFFDVIPDPVFDTQKAAAFLGYGYSISYQNLVYELSGIEIAKGETRSDWLRRPLTDRQQEYAALDVAYLPRIHEGLHDALVARGRLAALQRECEQMREIARLTEDEGNWQTLYLEMGAAWRLDRSELAVLRGLSLWREHEARKRNRPRPWIAKDSDLILLAREAPADGKALRGIADLSPALWKNRADELLEVIAEARRTRLPEGVVAIGKPLSQSQRKRLKKCQAVIRKKAEETGIAPELLARKKQLNALLLRYDEGGDFHWPLELEGWRRELFGRELMEAVATGEKEHSIDER